MQSQIAMNESALHTKPQPYTLSKIQKLKTSNRTQHKIKDQPNTASFTTACATSKSTLITKVQKHTPTTKSSG